MSRARPAAKRPVLDPEPDWRIDAAMAVVGALIAVALALYAAKVGR